MCTAESSRSCAAAGRESPVCSAECRGVRESSSGCTDSLAAPCASAAREPESSGDAVVCGSGCAGGITLKAGNMGEPPFAISSAPMIGSLSSVCNTCNVCAFSTSRMIVVPTTASAVTPASQPCSRAVSLEFCLINASVSDQMVCACVAGSRFSAFIEHFSHSWSQI